MRIMCRIGLHLGDLWERTAADCVRARTCESCGRRTTKYFHDLTWEYIRSQGCQRRGACRCGRKVQSDIRHQWSEREDISTRERIRRCQRCGIEEEDRDAP